MNEKFFKKDVYLYFSDFGEPAVLKTDNEIKEVMVDFNIGYQIAVDVDGFAGVATNVITVEGAESDLEGAKVGDRVIVRDVEYEITKVIKKVEGTIKLELSEVG